MRCSDLLDRVILDRDTTETLGRVGELLVSPREHRVRGIACAGFPGQELLRQETRRFTWSQVTSVGQDSLVVRANAPVGDPAVVLADCLPLTTLEIWSDGGERVGELVDFLLDDATGVIAEYLYVPAPQDGAPRSRSLLGLPRSHVISMGRRRMMVRETAMANAVPHPEWSAPGGGPLPGGLKLPRSVAAHVDSLPAPQQVGHQVQERAQQVAADAQTRMGEVMGTLRQRTRHLRTQLRETVTDLSASLEGDRPTPVPPFDGPDEWDDWDDWEASPPNRADSDPAQPDSANPSS